MGQTSGVERFERMALRARRDRGASRAAVEIIRAASRIARRIDAALGDAGLTLPQFNVLMELGATPGSSLPLYEVGARLISSAPNISWLTSRMQQSGLVEKVRATHDARVVELTLTEDGWAALERAMPLVFAVETDLLGDYTRAELEGIATLLGRLTSTEG